MADIDELPSDISPKCRLNLEKPPGCADVRAQRAYALCWAQWIGIREEHLDFSDALKMGWKRAKSECVV